MKTIRELITEYSSQLRDADTLSPSDASIALVELSSVLSSLNAEITRAEYAYNLLLKALRPRFKSVSDARLEAQAQQEWLDVEERKGQKEALVELIRSLKYFHRNALQEKQESEF